METITPMWRPASKSSNALLKAGYSQKQLNDIGKAFVIRFKSKQLENASTEFSKMVRKSGSGHDIKPKEDTALEDIQEVKAHKSDDGIERAQEAQQQEGVMSKAEAIAWYDSNRQHNQ